LNKNLLIIVALLLLAGGYMLFTKTPKTEPEPEAETTVVEVSDETKSEEPGEVTEDKMMSKEIALETVTVELGQSGVATVEDTAEGVVVMLTLSGYDSTVPQPAHIHLGACPDVGGVEYPLSNVVDGSSSTTLDASYDDLMAGLPLAINVHKSGDEASVYTACGDLLL